MRETYPDREVIERFDVILVLQELLEFLFLDVPRCFRFNDVMFGMFDHFVILKSWKTCKEQG